MLPKGFVGLCSKGGVGAALLGYLGLLPGPDETIPALGQEASVTLASCPGEPAATA